MIKLRALFAALLRTAFHALPLWPLSCGSINLTIAALLLVVLPYIKVKKLASQLEERCERGDKASELARTAKTIAFWRQLTFLK